MATEWKHHSTEDSGNRHKRTSLPKQRHGRSFVSSVSKKKARVSKTDGAGRAPVFPVNGRAAGGWDESGDHEGTGNFCIQSGEDGAMRLGELNQVAVCGLIACLYPLRKIRGILIVR